MPSTMQPVITAAVEGDVDEAILGRILNHVGIPLGTVYGRKGKQFLLRSIAGYNNAARFAPWVVLVDLDQDCDCAPPCVQKWLANPSPGMCFRIVVRAVEAWLLADRERLAQLLGVSVTLLPANPDTLANPKRVLVDLARRSRRSDIRRDLVPREGSGRAVGSLYTTTMIGFIQDLKAGWCPDRAMTLSESLARCMRRLKELAQQNG